MPAFEFVGRNNQGQEVKGKRLSQSPDSLSVQLMNEGIVPIKIVSREPTLNFAKFTFKKWFQGKISMPELSWFARQMYTLIKTGVPITLAIKQIADNAHSQIMANILHGILTSLEGGKDLAASMQQYSAVFTPIMINMIRVGQNSGQLAQAFLRLNEYFDMEVSTLKRTKSALRYPAFIFISIIAAIIIVNLFVIPTFARTFSGSGVELPLVTKILVGLSNFMTKNVIYFLLIFILIGGIFFYYMRQPAGRIVFDKTMMRLPVLGKILRYIIMLRFTQSFSIVIESGLSLTEGMRLVAEALQNRFAREEILLMSSEVERGKNLTQAAHNSQLFTSLEVQLFAVSEQTGELAAMLRQVADFYHREIDYDLKRLTDMVEPILILSLSALILLLAFAVYLPIWNMVSLVHT